MPALPLPLARRQVAGLAETEQLAIAFLGMLGLVAELADRLPFSRTHPTAHACTC